MGGGGWCLGASLSCVLIDLSVKKEDQGKMRGYTNQTRPKKNMPPLVSFCFCVLLYFHCLVERKKDLGNGHTFNLIEDGHMPPMIYTSVNMHTKS